MRSDGPYALGENHIHSAGIGHRAMFERFREMDIFLIRPVPNAHELKHLPKFQVIEAQGHPVYIYHVDRPVLEAEGPELMCIPTGIDIPCVADIPQPRTRHPDRRCCR